MRDSAGCHIYKSEKNLGEHPEKNLGRWYPKKIQKIGRFYKVPFKSLLRLQIIGVPHFKFLFQIWKLCIFIYSLKNGILAKTGYKTKSQIVTTSNRNKSDILSETLQPMVTLSEM